MYMFKFYINREDNVHRNFDSKIFVRLQEESETTFISKIVLDCTIEDVCNLLDEINFNSTTNITINDTDNIISDLENKLNMLIYFYKNDLWNMSTFTNFLNRKSNIRDVLSLSDAIRMKLDIDELRAYKKFSESQFQSLESKYNKMLLILQSIQDSNDANDQVICSNNETTNELNGDLSSSLVVSLSDSPTTVKKERNTCDTTVECDDHTAETVHSSYLPSSSFKKNEMQSNDVSISKSSTLVIPPTSTSNELDGSATTTNTTTSSDRRHQIERVRSEKLMNQSLFITTTSTTTQQQDKEGSLLFPSSTYISLDQMQGMIEDNLVILDLISQKMIDAIQPLEAQVQYRSSIISLLKKHIRTSLNCEAYEIGFMDVCCFLSEDPIQISAIMCRNHSTKWHRMLYDKLIALAQSKSNILPSNASTTTMLDTTVRTDNSSHDTIGSVDEDSCYASMCEHTIKNVLISSSKFSIQIQCIVDNLEIQLFCNSRMNICMKNLLEDVSILIGKDDLFKKSVLLIRAWWSVEASSLVGGSMKHYLSDDTIIVMIISVFNQYHKSISNALHALAFFLAEYADYNGLTQAISLQGIVKFKTIHSNIPNVLFSFQQHSQQEQQLQKQEVDQYLLGAEFLEKHWVLFSAVDCGSSLAEHPQYSTIQQPLQQQQYNLNTACSSSTTSADNLSELLSLTSNQTTIDINYNNASKLQSKIDDDEFQEMTEEQRIAMERIASLHAYRSNFSRNLQSFDRFNFNVINPFNGCNMINERLSENRFMRLMKVFRLGATNFSLFLNKTKQDNHLTCKSSLINTTTNNSNDTNISSSMNSLSLHNLSNASHQHVISLFQSLLPMIWNKYGDSMWRIDTLHSDLSKQYPYQILSQIYQDKCSLISDNNSDLLLRHVLYSNMMIESVITRSALFDLIIEILVQKGPLPIGEVGKSLTELTCITGLSLRLKQKFNGLKKFLEDYSHIVIIGNDHPFNPHIVLKSSLSLEQIAMVDRGIFPTQAVLKMKKITVSTMKRNAITANQKQKSISNNTATTTNTATSTTTISGLLLGTTVPVTTMTSLMSGNNLILNNSTTGGGMATTTTSRLTSVQPGMSQNQTLQNNNNNMRTLISHNEPIRYDQEVTGYSINNKTNISYATNHNHHKHQIPPIMISAALNNNLASKNIRSGSFESASYQPSLMSGGGESTRSGSPSSTVSPRSHQASQQLPLYHHNHNQIRREYQQQQQQQSNSLMHYFNSDHNSQYGHTNTIPTMYDPATTIGAARHGSSIDASPSSNAYYHSISHTSQLPNHPINHPHNNHNNQEYRYSDNNRTTTYNHDADYLQNKLQFNQPSTSVLLQEPSSKQQQQHSTRSNIPLHNKNLQYYHEYSNTINSCTTTTTTTTTTNHNNKDNELQSFLDSSDLFFKPSHNVFPLHDKNNNLNHNSNSQIFNQPSATVIQESQQPIKHENSIILPLHTNNSINTYSNNKHNNNHNNHNNNHNQHNHNNVNEQLIQHINHSFNSYDNLINNNNNNNNNNNSITTNNNNHHHFTQFCDDFDFKNPSSLYNNNIK